MGSLYAVVFGALNKKSEVLILRFIQEFLGEPNEFLRKNNYSVLKLFKQLEFFLATRSFEMENLDFLFKTLIL